MNHRTVGGLLLATLFSLLAGCAAGGAVALLPTAMMAGSVAYTFQGNTVHLSGPGVIDHARFQRVQRVATNNQVAVDELRHAGLFQSVNLVQVHAGSTRVVANAARGYDALMLIEDASGVDFNPLLGTTRGVFGSKISILLPDGTTVYERKVEVKTAPDVTPSDRELIDMIAQAAIRDLQAARQLRSASTQQPDATTVETDTTPGAALEEGWQSRYKVQKSVPKF